MMIGIHNMSKIRLMSILMIIISLTLLVSCSGRETGGDIVIGVAWPFKSNNSLFNEGIELAAEEINDNGGIDGRKLHLLKKDDYSSISRGMTVAESFVENDAVMAVIGHRNSYVTIPAARIYEDAGVVMLSPASTAPGLTRNGYQYIFRNIPSDNEIAKELTRYAARKGYRRLVIYYVPNAYGRGLADSLEKSARDAGINIVDRISGYASLSGLERLYRKWRALGFEGIFVAGSARDGAKFMADAKKVGITGPFFGGNAMDSPVLHTIVGKAAEGTIVAGTFNPHASRPEVQHFVKVFREKYHRLPGPYAAQGYDALKLLAEAVKRAGSAGPATVAGELHAIKNWSGVTGYHTFNDRGEDTGDLVVIKVLKNGKFVPLNDSRNGGGDRD